VFDVDKIAEVDFGKISGTRVGAVSVGTTSDGKVGTKLYENNNIISARKNHKMV
jgi:hypothetical protein